ncbi:DNA-3-methyladenine glycosylase 2 family protein [Rathayibacter sp. SD072]|uniref:DNA-3-methyladenine glycosylase 2 family protein n=1 Tax=Rathayibacter sp. SD072 TaxID=2781731 RepID=UPI001A96D322|nr:AlkA N-terminal domain-containing protein [Rathayibacter sp. SD072]MBO0985546.1 DNA-3-methyladenine glycosylase 2 family protein [Rathayibacter sp. SD072]
MPTADPLFDERYRAVASRDARFDGRFITGVHSTGIYCRPSCPAATPRPRNVRFYPTAAAAHEAGLRACKRCLPDAVPGSPEWNLRDDTAARAMRLIADGVVDREGVEGLAARLGYGARHLGRILREELGAPPLALARAQRAQTARLLLTGTELPVSEVAFAAGFASIRQFNATIAEVYERTPSALRASARGARTGVGVQAGATTLELRLPLRAPFHAGVLDFLAVRAIGGIEEGAPGVYARSLALPGGPAVMRLEHDGAAVRCTATLASITDIGPLVSRVRRLLDLDADAPAIDEALAADPLLAPLVAAAPGIRLPGSVDPAETLVRTLLGQQVSVAAARTALTRLVAHLGGDLPGTIATGSITRCFPSPAVIAERGAEVLRGPARRIDTVLRVCALLADGGLRLDAGWSREELSEHLLAVPGIGPWTAGYVAMRVTGDPDVLLTGDLALRNGAAAAGLPADPRALAEAGRRWAPWRSYAGMHLWRAATGPKRAG